jgi:DNA-binding HxlR family transcriptional regulator
LDVVKWTLLIIRDFMFKGKRRYSEFAEADEKIATNVLAGRLTRLEAEGLVTRRVDPMNARQRLYSLTDAGLDLAPLLVEMILWSAKHDRDSAADRDFVHEAQQNRTRLLRSVASAARSQRSKNE